MKTKRGNILDKMNKYDAVCITTNGFVTTTTKAVMGRGIAYSFDNRFNIAYKLGKILIKKGNHVHIILKKNKYHPVICSMPVKPFSVKVDKKCINIVRHARYNYRKGEYAPGFHAVADIKIIKKSTKELVKMADQEGWKKVLLPRPGCGAGELTWKEVKPVLNKILDDRFTCMTFN